MTRLAALAVAVLLALTGCTVDEVVDVFATVGVDLDQDTAADIAAIAARDCLPSFDTDPYIECAIRDSWERYDVPTSLTGWANIAWCESRFDPQAKNPRSSASGIFQQLARYWPARAQAAGYPGGSIWQPRVNAMVSAHLAATSGLQHWVCKP